MTNEDKNILRNLSNTLSRNEKVHVGLMFIVQALRDPDIFDNQMLSDLRTLQECVVTELKYRRDKGIQ